MMVLFVFSPYRGRRLDKSGLIVIIGNESDAIEMRTAAKRSGVRLVLLREVNGKRTGKENGVACRRGADNAFAGALNVWSWNCSLIILYQPSIAKI